VTGRIGGQTPLGRGFTFTVYGVVLTLLAVPLLMVEIPPLYDYPNHLARMHILAHYADSPELQANYTIAWKLSPYLGMDLIVPPLARHMSIYTSGRLFLYLCLVQIVAGTALVHAALYRRFSPWPAASALFAYSLILSLGFVNYLFAIGVWLFAFGGWILLSRRGGVARVAAGTILSFAVFFSHFFAFAGYMLCVGAYEFGVWWNDRAHAPGARPLAALFARPFAALFARGFIAFLPFIPPLALMARIDHGQTGGVTWYGGPVTKLTALLSPIIFPSARFDLALLALLLVIPARRGVFGPVTLAPQMRMPLLVLGFAVLAMPNVLAGVWDMDCRLPLAFVFLAIAGFQWRAVPERAGKIAACCLVALLTLNMALIVWAWQPIARQYDAFRAALPAIPRGARVIAFRDEDGIDKAQKPGPPIVYSHLPALAIIERDVFLPTLFKNPMMPVQAAAATREIDSAGGDPIELPELLDGADPVKGPAHLGKFNTLGNRDYWGGWQTHFDDAIELSFGAHPALPPELRRTVTGTFFNIYRIAP